MYIRGVPNVINLENNCTRNTISHKKIFEKNITLDKDYDPEETKSLNCFIYSTTGNYTEQFRNTFSHKCRNMENKELTTWYVDKREYQFLYQQRMIKNTTFLTIHMHIRNILIT